MGRVTLAADVGEQCKSRKSSHDYFMESRTLRGTDVWCEFGSDYTVTPDSVKISQSIFGKHVSYLEHLGAEDRSRCLLRPSYISLAGGVYGAVSQFQDALLCVPIKCRNWFVKVHSASLIPSRIPMSSVVTQTASDGRVGTRIQNYTSHWQKDLSKDTKVDNRVQNYTDVINGIASLHM